MIGKVEMTKSFDEEQSFMKELESGDLKRFFEEEGVYLESLVGIMREHGKRGDEFVITYTVTVTA